MSDSNTTPLTTNKMDADSTNKAKNLCDLPDELLLQILSTVPLKDRVYIRSVSKKWHSIVLDLGYHLEPDFISWPDTPYYPWGMPTCQSEFPIRFNPSLHILTGLYQIREKKEGFYPFSEIDEWDAISLRKRRSEFITSPPISMVKLFWSSEGSWMNEKAALMILRTATPAWKNSEGVRIGDLLDIFEKLMSSTTQNRLAYSLGISFAYAFKDEYSHYTITQKAVGDAGIELLEFNNW